MPARTDLAVECLDFARETQLNGAESGRAMPNGVTKEVFQENGVEVTRVRVVNLAGVELTGKPMGEYLTVDTSDFKGTPARFETEVEALAGLIRTMLPATVKETGGECPCALVVGLGNRDITPDALGPKAAGYILATRHITQELAAQIGLAGLKPVAVIAAGVMGQTGIETAEITGAVAQRLSPAVVIVIDSLAAKSVDRLATTVQISNTGISPGSGVQNSRAELSEKTLGIPVISIGVPMVVDMMTVACDMLGEEASSGKVSVKGQGMMVTPREIDQAVEHAAKTIAFAINSALQPDLSLEELIALAG